jgi:ATP-binding cassette subfamily B protein
MNVVERAPPQGARVVPEPSPAAAPAAAAAPPSPRPRLQPLVRLLPYVRRYRGRAFAALGALLVAALATLAVPLAVRRVIDFGFSGDDTGLIDSYFAMLIAVAAVLACASAARYYLVITLGERIVADLRSDLFAHLTRLSVAYFDQVKSGEMLSRLTTDATHVRTAVGASVSTALRNIVLFVGAVIMMVVTSPRLSAFVLLAIPLIVLPLYAFGRSIRRRSRAAQQTLAEASAYANELIGGVRTLQAFTNEALARERFASAIERAFRAARSTSAARAFLTANAIFLVAASVVLVLWIGAQDVATGEMTQGRLSQFILYAVLAATGLGQLSETWGEISQASGAAERLFEIMSVRPTIEAPARPVAFPVPSPCPPAANSPLTTCASPTRRDRRRPCSAASRSASGPAKRLRSSALPAPARARSSTSSCASTIPSRAASASMACA